MLDAIRRALTRLWPRREPELRDHETCIPHEHVETDMGRWERDQAASLARAARSSGPTFYDGQHNDCIATVPHYHDRPYKAGEWAATFDDGWAARDHDQPDFDPRPDDVLAGKP